MKDIDILYEMYRRAYRASTPEGDFDKILEEAKIDETTGEKIIPYMDYECEMEVMKQIVEDVLKEKKVPRRKHNNFKMSFMLGVSPKTKKS